MNDHLLGLVAAGDRRALAWAVQAARRVVATGGALGFEQAAGLASTPAKRRRALRDFAIVQAARALGGGDAATPLQLHLAVEQFRRACWPIWSARQVPPASATQVEVALFHAFKAGGIPGTPQGIGKILRTFKQTKLLNLVSETG